MYSSSLYSNEKIIGQMNNFGLKQVAPHILDILEIAEREQITYKSFLSMVLDTEVIGRNEKRRRRNFAGAHFPPAAKSLEEFDPSELKGGISKSQINMLSELDWIDKKCNVLLLGPPGVGKTHLAVGLGLLAVQNGYTVCFENMTNLIKIFDEAPYKQKQSFRLKNLLKASLIIIDEIGYVPVTREQANKFFTFISETYEQSAMIFTTNKDVTEWAELFGDPVITQAMLDRILHHAKCFSLEGDSYRLKHPDLFSGTEQRKNVLPDRGKN